jgi:enoyl-CoA hydratase
VARHTEEGLAFVSTALTDGPREAVRRRDQPFADYAQRSSTS